MRRILMHAAALFIASSLVADHHGKKPAFDVLGSWNATAVTPNNEEIALTLKFEKKGEKITGTSFSHRSGTRSEIQKLSIAGHDLKYEIPRNGQEGTFHLSFKHADHQLKGEWVLVGSDDTEVARGSIKAELTVPNALLGRWNMLVDLNGNEIDYGLKISEAEGKLKGVLISPRSGERPLKSVAFKKGQLVMSEIRDYQGEELQSKYTASLKDGELTGTFDIDGAPGAFSGDWSASK